MRFCILIVLGLLAFGIYAELSTAIDKEIQHDDAVVLTYWNPLNPEYVEGKTVFCSASMKDKEVYQRGWEE